MKGGHFKLPSSGTTHPKVGMPSPSKIHPAANIKTQVRFPDSSAIGAAPAVQTPVGRI